MSNSRPDIIVVMVDDMGFSDLGCYGSEIATPNIDSLANNGIRYTQFYNCARCCPTRASLLTGLYPHRAGIGHMTVQSNDQFINNRNLDRPAYQGYLNNNTVTVAEALKIGGYQTFMSGKWHVGSFRPNWPTDRGFDRFYGMLSGACSYWSPGSAAGLLSDSKPIEETPEGYYTTDVFSDHAVQFVDEAKADDPYFLYLAYNAPHWPLHAWEDDIKKYRGSYKKGWDHLREERFKRQKDMGLFPASLELPPRDPECPSWEKISSSVDGKGRTFSAEEWDLRMAVYAAMIDRVDQGIGRVIDKIREKRDLDNTVIMLLSDNGACAESYDPVANVPAGPKESDTAYFLPWANASNTPFRLFKHWLHEGGSATPFIVHYPQLIKQGRIDTEYYAHVKDIMATCLDLSGTAYPETQHGYPVNSLDSCSILPNMNGDNLINDEALFLEHEGNRAVRKGKWKLVSFYNENRGFTASPVGKGKRTGKWELYDMENDRTELNDISLENTKLRDQLIEEYGRFAERTGVDEWEIIQQELDEMYSESLGKKTLHSDSLSGESGDNKYKPTTKLINVENL